MVLCCSVTRTTSLLQLLPVGVSHEQRQHHRNIRNL
jgi:hypothetical protein